nr:integrase, catalytic region, zinc finger, CCHC-type, peptidase aspartic, catalytic [Tanacetum cinerariifolium]
MGTVREPLAEGTKGAPHLGLPKDIYTLINHYTDAKDIWDNVKMLLEGSELTKEDRESQLYDDFKHFRQHKGETIHDYYVWFAKLINDMRNINMTMSRMQLNSKFVNNMLLEWGRFVTAAKLNRGLRDSNYNQLYAYLKQHETHANENKMMLDRFSQHTVDPLALMSNRPWEQSTGWRCSWVWRVQNRVGNANLGQARQDLALNVDNVFQADDCDAFDYDVDEAPMSQTMFMANLSSADPVNDEAGLSYDSDILSEVQDHDHYQDAVCAHHEEHAMHDNVQLNHVVDSHADYTSNSNMISYDQYVKDNAVPVIHSNVSSILNDAYMVIYNDMYEPHAQSVSKTSPNTVVENSLTAKLATYKEQVKLYERRARNNREVHLDYLRHLKESVETIRNIVEEAKVIVLWYLDSSCSKHMTGDRSRLLNFVKKFIGTVQFGNDHFGSIMGYGDYVVVQIVLWYLDPGCSKHMTGDRSRLMNFVKKFIETVRFENDHFGAIMCYGDYVGHLQGILCGRTGHNLFSVGQFCDSDLEVAFRKHSCYVRDTDGVELIKGSCGYNLYTISVEDMMKSSPICLLSKASKHKSWLWHQRLNHLNFGTVNDLARKDLVRGCNTPKNACRSGILYGGVTS